MRNSQQHLPSLLHISFRICHRVVCRADFKADSVTWLMCTKCTWYIVQAAAQSLPKSQSTCIAFDVAQTLETEMIFKKESVFHGKVLYPKGASILNQLLTRKAASLSYGGGSMELTHADVGHPRPILPCLQVLCSFVFNFIFIKWNLPQPCRVPPTPCPV